MRAGSAASAPLSELSELFTRLCSTDKLLLDIITLTGAVL
jgi:hypothetical protein